MPRGAVSKHRSGDFRMGEPTLHNRSVSIPEHIGNEKVTRGTETSKYPEEEKEKSIPGVAASEMGRA